MCWLQNRLPCLLSVLTHCTRGCSTISQWFSSLPQGGRPLLPTKGGETSGIFSPWGGNRHPSKYVRDSRGRSRQGKSLLQHVYLLLASLIKPPITYWLSTGTPGGQAPQCHPAPLNLEAQLGGEDRAFPLNPQVCKCNGEGFKAWLQEAMPAAPWLAAAPWIPIRPRVSKGHVGCAAWRGALPQREKKVFPREGNGNHCSSFYSLWTFLWQGEPSWDMPYTLRRTRWPSWPQMGCQSSTATELRSQRDFYICIKAYLAQNANNQTGATGKGCRHQFLWSQ